MIEAMKQALEALEIGWSPKYVNGVDAREKGMKAITSLRQAIEEAEKQEPVAVVQDLDEVKRKHLVYECGFDWKDPLYTHPQPKAEKHEPVACQHKRYSIDVHEQIGTCIDCGSEGRMRFVVDDTHPQPKREPLTDEQIEKIWHDQTGLSYFANVAEFVRAIEAAHGITSDMKQEYVDKTAKQRHEWVGLTDEEFESIRNSLFRQEGWDGYGWDLGLKEAIEAKLKDKNGF